MLIFAIVLLESGSVAGNSVMPNTEYFLFVD